MATSNHNPKYICRYYLETLEKLGGSYSYNYHGNPEFLLIGCPAILRSDYGTENSILAAIQIALRYEHGDSLAKERSFIYGPSKNNVVCVSFSTNCDMLIIIFFIHSELRAGGPGFGS